MRMKSVFSCALKRFFISAALCLAAPYLADAAVSGPCDGCHTMHNSQGGNTTVQVGAGTGWSDAGAFSGTASATAQDYLLVSDCVGCHSNAGGQTIVTPATPGMSDVPIVFNLSGPAEEELAGGNFYWVQASGDNFGHNVKGISGADLALSAAPGFKAGKGCAGSCHESLVNDVTGVPGSGYDQTGCQGCHFILGHHDNPSDAAVNPGPANGGGDAYRFLGGHGGGVGVVDNLGASTGDGFYREGDKWGRSDGIQPNVYDGQSDSEVQTLNPIAIGRWCAGCHNAFHAPGVVDDMLGEDNQGDRDGVPISGTPWLRHPTNVNLGLNGEFAWTNPSGLPYTNNPIPLARAGAATDGPDINPADQVFCLSCHKAHGSQYPDSLRFPYDAANMSAHSDPTGSSTNGCFYCHRLKDDQ